MVLTLPQSMYEPGLLANELSEIADAHVALLGLAGAQLARGRLDPVLERRAGEEVETHAEQAEDEQQERQGDERELDSGRAVLVTHQPRGREASAKERRPESEGGQSHLQRLRWKPTRTVSIGP